MPKNFRKILCSVSIKDTNLIPQLMEEVQDICTTLQWKYQMIDQGPAKGICFSPPECETLFLTFSERGEICSPLLLQYNIHPATTISVKTQFAGMEVHMTIIKVLQHLKTKYFSEFEMYDEGGYWQSRRRNNGLTGRQIGDIFETTIF